MLEEIIIAVDVGSESVKIFAGGKSQDGNIEIKNSGFFPADGYLKGEITDVNALCTGIKRGIECVTGVSVDGLKASVYLGLGGTFLKNQESFGSVALANANKVTEKDFERACKAAVFALADDDFEVLHAFVTDSNFLEKKRFDEKDVINKPFFSKPVEGDGLKVAAHIVSAPKALLARLRKSFSLQGIEIAGIVANCIVGPQNVLVNSVEDKGNYIFLDIGANAVDIALIGGGGIKDSASLPLGSNYITNDIMRGLEVSFVHAEEIKHYYSKLDKALYGQRVFLDCNGYDTTDKSFPYDFLHNIIESRVDEIVHLVYKYLELRIYEKMRRFQIDKLVLAGGGIALASFAEKFSNVFGSLEYHAVNFAQLPVEYNHPANTACYGIFSYAKSQIGAQESEKEINAPAANIENKEKKSFVRIFSKYLNSKFD